MAYTPGMIVADAVAANLVKGSWIRRMFEEGAGLKQELGTDKVFDFLQRNQCRDRGGHYPKGDGVDLHSRRTRGDGDPR
jgi:hypothetical protein